MENKRYDNCPKCNSDRVGLADCSDLLYDDRFTDFAFTCAVCDFTWDMRTEFFFNKNITDNTPIVENKPYGVCPKCNSSSLGDELLNMPDGLYGETSRCMNCGFEWLEVYKFLYNEARIKKDNINDD